MRLTPTQQFCFSFQIPTWDRIDFALLIRSGAYRSSSKLGPEAKEMTAEGVWVVFAHNTPRCQCHLIPWLSSQHTLLPPHTKPLMPLLNEPTAFLYTTINIISPFPGGATHNSFQLTNAEVLSQGQGSWNPLSPDDICFWVQNNCLTND